MSEAHGYNRIAKTRKQECKTIDQLLVQNVSTSHVT